MKYQNILFLLFMFFVCAGTFVHAQERVLNASSKAQKKLKADAKKDDTTALALKDILLDSRKSSTFIYVVQANDTIGKIAKKFYTTIELIKELNFINGDIIRIGQKLSIWGEPFIIEIITKENILNLKLKDRIIKSYHVSTGKEETKTVPGEYYILSRLIDPVWNHKGDIVPSGDPRNAIGSRWLGFSEDGYGIHGTIAPDTIGQSVSSGCVRMNNSDVEEIFNVVPLGTKVVIK